MGQVKPGYGPKDPTPIRGIKGDDPKTARAPRERGFPVSYGQAKDAAGAAIEAGRAVRAARANGGDVHGATQSYNTQMAALQQIHPGLHQSVLAINHLEGLVDQGATDPKIRDQLAQAHGNLRARLNQGARQRGGR